VVWDTESTKVSGLRSNRRLYSVPFPTPEGPEMTMGFLCGGRLGMIRETVDTERARRYRSDVVDRIGLQAKF